MTAEREIRDDGRRLKYALLAGCVVVALLWLAWIATGMLHADAVEFGVYPRRLKGLTGILTAPLVHGSANHLLANSGPVLVLVAILLYGYPRSAPIVFTVLYPGTGMLVWLCARPAWHLGASGVTFGMMFFVFVVGVLRRDRRAMALSLSVFLLYGGMFAGLAPDDPGISFESHLAGAALGTLLAILLRSRDPLPSQPRYSWEGEDDTS